MENKIPNINKDKVVKIIRIIVILAVAAVLLMNSLYIVKETESAIVTTFGNPTLNTNRGLQFKIPFIQEVERVNTTVRSLTIGYTDLADGTTADNTAESTMITSDMNFIMVDFYVTYQVTDPVAFLYHSDDPAGILKNMVQNAIRSTVSAYPVDSVLTVAKSDIQTNIKEVVKENLETSDIGLSIVDIQMQDAEPPTQEIKDAFAGVETEKQNKESAINEANKYRNEQLPLAEAQADKVVREAEAKKEARINEANGQVARFLKEYEEYVKYPLITKQRMFYEAMEEILPSVKIIINDDESGGKTQVFMNDLSQALTDTQRSVIGNAAAAQSSPVTQTSSSQEQDDETYDENE